MPPRRGSAVERDRPTVLTRVMGAVPQYLEGGGRRVVVVAAAAIKATPSSIPFREIEKGHGLGRSVLTGTEEGDALGLQRGRHWRSRNFPPWSRVCSVEGGVWIVQLTRNCYSNPPFKDPPPPVLPKNTSWYKVA